MSEQQTVDAVVVGAGPNGLVAANLLADAGWEVLVLEAQPEPGGAVRSDRAVHPDYVHDTFSSFYPLAAASPTIRGLQLEAHGLTWVHAPAVVGTPLREGGWALLHRSREETADGLERQQPGDGRAWLRWCEQWEDLGPHLLRGLLTPFPPVRAGARLLPAVVRSGGPALVRQLLAPASVLSGQEFAGPAPGLLLCGNAGHADIPVTAPGSGLMGFLLTMLGQQLGFPVPEGGAQSFTAALVRRLESKGGQLRTGTAVTGVVVRDARAVGVRTQHEEIVHARRAVLADVTAPALYGQLVPWTQLPGSLKTRMQRFEWDPGTVKLDWALDGPVPWADQPGVAPGTVHLLDSPTDLEHTQSLIRSGQAPRRPYLVIGQMAASDPSRAPEGTESVWAYTHVPRQWRRDQPAPRGAWDEADRAAMIQIIEDRVAEHAPGFTDRVVARRLLTPPDMQAANANLVGGAMNGGTAALHQQLIFRPVPGLGRAETPIRRLYLASASAHPGGGVHGACGANAARAALWHARLRR